MRVAAVDMGTNSTRLLVAEVDGDRVEELLRLTNVTRLGEGVDRSGRLSDEAIERVTETCERYRDQIDQLGAKRAAAVLTSAVRDASNGEVLLTLLRERFGFEAEVISGEREARLTYLGATSGRTVDEPVLVLDIGGGSTEFVIGRGGSVEFHASAQLGSVRFTERYLHSDPPTQQEIRDCRAATRELIERSVPSEWRSRPVTGIAVAGTPTSFAAIDQKLVPYDRDRVHGYRFDRATCERIAAELTALPIVERRQVAGLHPDRAPTILAGGYILLETMDLFGLGEIEVSEHDILDSVAMEAASDTPSSAGGL